jgi:hypothetical protein
MRRQDSRPNLFVKMSAVGGKLAAMSAAAMAVNSRFAISQTGARLPRLHTAGIFIVYILHEGKGFTPWVTWIGFLESFRAAF